MQILIKSLIILIITCNISFADIINKIIIKGNNRISEDTIKSLSNFEIGKKYNVNEINLIQKKIFESNFFKDVIIELDVNTLTIKVVENPMVNFFYIEGVTFDKREDLIYSKIQLGDNKIFSESILKKDIELIKDIYRTDGYFNLEVVPKISKIDENNVNLVLSINENKRYKIKNIYFIGNKFYKNSDLLDIISSSTDSWWKFMSTSSILNLNRVEYDNQLLTNFYLDEGFLNFEVVSSDISVVSDNYVNLTFSINPGKKFFFNKFNIADRDNNLIEQDLNYIDSLIKKRLVGNYSLKNLLFVQDIIKNYLTIRKIDFVNVNFKVSNKDYNNNLVDIDFIFASEEKKFINSIFVSGNSITNEDVIRRNLTFAEGDAFSTNKLEKSKNNLNSLGIFKNNSINAVPLNKNLVDISVKVEEQPTGSINAGVGLGTEGGTIQTSLIERNFNGSGINVNAGVSLGTQKISGSIGFTVPDFLNSDKSLNYRIYALTTDYENAGYESKVIGNSVSTKYNIFEDVFLTNGFAIDLDKIDTNSTASDLYKSREGSYQTFKGFYKIENDKRNRRFQPTSGYLTSFGQTLALPGSKIKYLENNIYGTYYFPLSNNYIVNLKGSLNSINAIDKNDVKLSDRLFNSQSNIRGFESRGIGPKDGTEHIGGNYSAFTSLSSTFPNYLPEKWNAKTIIFLDAGNVWSVDYDESLDSNSIRSSTGISLDWISPIGPISLTLAQTLSSEDGDLEESFTFNLGSTF